MGTVDVKQKVNFETVAKCSKILCVDSIGPFTYAQVEYIDPIREKKYTGYGQARQGFGDRFKKEIGENIAISRARKAAMKKANGEIIHLACMG